MSVRINVDGKNIDAFEGQSILQAALKAGIYIPHLCFHPDLPSFEAFKPDEVCYQGDNEFHSDSQPDGYDGCGLCLVEIAGQTDPVLSCMTIAEEGMIIKTFSYSVQTLRLDNMVKIFASYSHDCLQFDECELSKLVEYVGLKENIGRYVKRDRYVEDRKPLFIRDYNLCIGCLRCVRVCSHVVGAEALAFTSSKGTITVGTKKPSIGDSGCVYCGACVEVCPTGALRDKNLKPGDRKKALIPCRAVCPLDMDAPTYVHFISQGSFDEAARTIREKTPMGMTLGYICPHPCESVCRRGDLNEPIAICNLKRLALETKDAVVTGTTDTAVRTGKKVAVVGAGPVGLVAAAFLTVFGHDVTAFESAAEAGGMLRWAIPEYRLPRQIIKHEISSLEAMGVCIRTNSPVDPDFFRDELDQEKWDAVFLATGAKSTQKKEVDGMSLQGVFWGLDFLMEAKEGWAPDVGKSVVVVGGGKVAMDVAMTALRLGADKVDLVCQEKRDEMPAFDREIQQAEKEGIVLHTGWGVQKIFGDGTRVFGVELVGCDSAAKLQADSVILAAGQKPEVDYLPPNSGIHLRKDGTFRTKLDNLETDKSGFFAGGEARSGPASAVEAMAEGRRAASAIDRFLGGRGLDDSPQEVKFFDRGLLWRGQMENFKTLSRVDMAELSVEERIESFALPRLGYSAGEGQVEAERCLKCHLRFLLSPAVLPPVKPREKKNAKG